jgi:hypothetical protein
MHDDELQARADAVEIAAQLGNGWMPNVWHDDYWLYDVQKGPVLIRKLGDRRFLCIINCDLDSPQQQQFLRMGETAEEALTNTVRLVQSTIDNLTEILDTVKNDHTAA